MLKNKSQLWYSKDETAAKENYSVSSMPIHKIMEK
jgi:hypothetical protein